VDSVTQFFLGAAVAGAITGKRRALLYGAALGTLPDLDVLVHFSDPIDRLTLHRTASHSLLVLSLLAPVLLWLALKLDKVLRVQTSAERGRWLLAFWLALITHPLLDYTTIYGTQLFWPLDRMPLGTGHMFIIDPLYTVPLIIGVLWHWRRTWRGSVLAVLLSSAYLSLGWFTQQMSYARVLADLGPMQPQQKLLVTAAPLTIFMHRAVLREPGGYREAYLSLIADHGPLRWQQFASDDTLIATLTADPHAQKSWARLARFSHGFVALKQVEVQGQTHLIASDLRMGSAPNYVFNFDFGGVDALYPMVQQRPAVQPNLATLRWVLQRIVTPAHELPLPSEVYGKSTFGASP
jgi:inner membrane protein